MSLDPPSITRQIVGRRTVLAVSAWSVPVVVLAIAAPAASASGPITDFSLAATALTLSSIPSGGGSSPLTLTISEVGGAASTGPIAVFVTRLNAANGLTGVSDSFVADAVDGWTVEQTDDHFAFTYTSGIAAHSSSTTLTGTWKIALAPARLVSAIATATITAGSGGDTNVGNNQVSLPFATTNQIDLGAATDYTLIGQAALTDTGGASTFDGAIGFEPGAALTGFSPAAQALFGSAASNAQAETDTRSALATATALPATAALPGALGGVTLLPGVYRLAAAIGLTGVLTFDAGGDPSASFILVTGGAFTTAASSSMVLSGGARASRIFWVTTGAVTLGADSAFVGTALIGAAVTAGARATVTGRLLATNAAVTLSANPIRLP
ncbi:DUF3494 domain-containing protein [Subtercola endophyticus]|uniref:DUF3494 domain-containing protein n=1 Tax=Subtercola endophyticus TaxID=2895559 RepID=UPI001E3E29FE|nr:DUF3494 domain-containing protein [Subtercola endophyticus]UFS60437.1 DUF3494 domain-containing protein [Subtercola endophyticus]